MPLRAKSFLCTFQTEPSQRLQSIAVELSRGGHSWARIEKIIGGNFARVFREIWVS